MEVDVQNLTTAAIVHIPTKKQEILDQFNITMVFLALKAAGTVVRLDVTMLLAGLDAGCYMTHAFSLKRTMSQ